MSINNKQKEVNNSSKRRREKKKDTTKSTPIRNRQAVLSKEGSNEQSNEKHVEEIRIKDNKKTKIERSAQAIDNLNTNATSIETISQDANVIVEKDQSQITAEERVFEKK